ncbi:MAG: hypothetical protein NWF00_03550 [Candidatus Bathyarchaeota archaeon]|nr:hypothetical protein [Candidatus Bathyarchaeota archaeon]
MSNTISGEGARRDRRKAMVYMRHPRIWDQFYGRITEGCRFFRDYFNYTLSDSAKVPTVNVVFVSSAGGGFGSGVINELSKMTKKGLEDRELSVRQWLILVGAPRNIDLADKELLHSQLNEFFLLRDVLFLQSRNNNNHTEVDPNGRTLTSGPYYNAVYVYPLMEMSPSEYKRTDQHIRDFILSKILLPAELYQGGSTRVMPLENLDNAIRQAELNYCRGERFSFGSFQVCHLSVPIISLVKWNELKDRERAIERLLEEDSETAELIKKRTEEMASADYMNVEIKDIESWLSALKSDTGNKIAPLKEAVAEVIAGLQFKLNQSRHNYEAVNSEKARYDDEIQKAREQLAHKNELNFIGKRSLRRAIENYQAILRPLQDDLMEKKEQLNKLQTLINKFIEIRDKIGIEHDQLKTELSTLREKLYNLQQVLERTQSPSGLAGFQLPFKEDELSRFREIFWVPGLRKIDQLPLSDIGMKVYGENRFLNIVNAAFRKAADAPIYVDFINSGDGGPKKYPVQMVNLVSGEANNLEYLQSVFQAELGLQGSGEYGVGWYIAQAENLGSSIYLAIEFDGIPPTQIKDLRKLEELYNSLRDRVQNGQCYPLSTAISLVNPIQSPIKEIGPHVNFPNP